MLDANQNSCLDSYSRYYYEKVTKLKDDQLDADMAGDDPLKGRDAFLANYANTMRVIQAVA